MRILSLGVIIFILCVKALANDYQITVYTRHQGLPQDYVYTLLQDQKNYLWVGTGNGLVKFDGKTFLHYKTSSGLKEDFITASCITPFGERIFSHFGGNISSFYNGQFKSYTTKKVTTASITNIIFRNNFLWVGTKEGEVMAIHNHNKSIKKWLLGQYESVEFIDSTKNASNILVATEALIYLLEYNSTNKTEKITKYRVPDGSGIKSISRLNSRKWLVASQDNNIYILEDSENGLKFSNLSMSKFSANIGFIHSTGNNRFWLTNDDGLWTEYKYFQNNAIQISTVKLPANFSHMVPNLMFEDNEGNVWIGTFGSGLIKLSIKRSIFYSLGPQSETKVNSVLMSSSNDILLGTNHGIYQSTPNLGKFSLRNVKLNDGVVSICEVTKNEFIIATENSVVYRWDPSNDKLISWTIPISGQDKVKQIVRDRDNNIWIATSSGAILFDVKRKQFRIFTMEDGMAHNYVYCVFPDSHGRVWFGTHKSGLSYYNGKKIITLQSPLDNSGLDINCFSEDNNGNVWVGTSGQGLFLIDKQDKFIKFISTADGLLSDYIYFFQKDLQGATWVGHKNGLERIITNPHNNAVISDYSQYIAEKELTQATYQTKESSNIWIGGLNVCIRFDVSPENKSPIGSYVDISDLKLNYDNINWSERGKIKYQNEIPDNLIFKHNENLLTFTFNGISFSYNEKLRYQYKLSGFDDNWSLLTEQNFVTYNKLPPGSYTFLVKSRNYAGIWSSQPTSLHFQITPPYWETWWFRILFFLILIISVYLFIKIRTSTLRKRNQALEIEKNKLENEIKERKLVESKLLKSELSLTNTNQELSTLIYRASHDLRGPVSTISGLVNVAHLHIADKESLNFFDMINTSVARLDQILKKLFLVSEIKQNDIIPEIFSIRNSLETVISSFKSEIKEKNFKIVYKGEDLNFCSDKKLFETIVKNIVDNSFTYNRKSDPELIVQITRIEDSVLINFWDNGKGIKSEHQIKIFDMFYKASDLSKGNGLGLYIAKNAIQLLKGEISVSSKENEFTQINVSIPEYQKKS
ncbi:MAG: hypothetical protein H7329_12040 [Opitutaceae bacterium]|nr:hypothetical protein [Cytophagales bacterium]